MICGDSSRIEKTVKTRMKKGCSIEKDGKEEDEEGVFKDDIEVETRLPSHLQGSDKVPQNEESEPVAKRKV
jgi:hypothetical protein